MRSTDRHHGRAIGASPADLLPEALEPRQVLAAGPATAFQTTGNEVANLGGSPSDAIAVEFNQDGKQDMVVAMEKQVYFLRGRGGGRFDEPVQIQRLNAKAGLVSVGDFNADGRPDFVSVQPGRTGGYMRLFLNTGDGQFQLVSYARTGTAVESVINGDLNFSAGDEIVVQGRSAEVNPQTGQSDYELRLFRIDLNQPALGDGTPGAALVDSGVYRTASRMGTAIIAPVVHNSPFIVVGREDPSNPGQGLVEFLVANTAPLPGLDLRGSISGIQGTPTASAYGDFNSDGKGDLLVSTLQYPSGGQAGIDSGTFTARTYEFVRRGFDFDVQFETPAVIDQRSLAGQGGMARTWAPEYKVTGPWNINNDDRPDFGVSIVQDFNSGANRSARREASWVQFLQNSDGTFASSTVASRVVTGVRADVPFDRVVTFLPNDVRRTGRPDLVFIDQTSFSDVPRFRALYNIKAINV